MPRHEAIQIAERIWWVGVRLASDQFQCHAYFIDNGPDSVLVDPGSPLTIRETLDKVSRVADVDSIRYLVCHHADPDVAASLPALSDALTRQDVVVVSEWRAAALLKHYGHRFDYYLVEDHGWTLDLGDGRSLDFQLTPYLHFPGAFVSFETATGTLFSSDLFGGFVPDSDVLVSHDLDYVLDSARPFHQHYMPSTALLCAGLSRIQQRWPVIAMIAPQHGHVIPPELVDPAFAGLKQLDCGVFALADADLDLQRLLRISEAKAQLTDALLTITSPESLVAALDAVVTRTRAELHCDLYVDIPEAGWTRWSTGTSTPKSAVPPQDHALIPLPGTPGAVLAFETTTGVAPDEDLLRMLTEMAHAVRPAVDRYLARSHEARLLAVAAKAALTDPLTGLGNRRALDEEPPSGTFAVLSLDLDHFKAVNDAFGHAAGDTVLRRVAGACMSAVRRGDRVYRLGGEEFLVLLPDAEETMAVAIAERVRAGVAQLSLAGYAPHDAVTVSIGVATSQTGLCEEPDAVVARADAALYASKEHGRNCVSVAAGHGDG